MSYTASSSVFADIIRYPRFFRFVPIAEEFAEGFVAVIKELKWKRVAVISYIDEFMLKVNTTCKCTHMCVCQELKKE